jgi:hypothetical protein
MRRKISTGLAMLAVAVTGLVAVTTASAAAPATTGNFVATGEQFQPIGFSEDRAPRAGDAFVGSGSLYEWAGRKRGKRIGRFELHVVATSDRGGYQTGVAFLPGGQIIFAGFTPFADVPVEHQAVTGGTGRYEGARGSVTVRGLPGGDNSAVTIRLLP